VVERRKVEEVGSRRLFGGEMNLRPGVNYSDESCELCKLRYGWQDGEW